MEIHQMAPQIGSVRGVFTETIIFEGDINKPTDNKTLLVESEKQAFKIFSKFMNSTPRASKYNEERPKPVELKNIKLF